jgi:hypothetical protein
MIEQILGAASAIIGWCIFAFCVALALVAMYKLSRI